MADFRIYQGETAWYVLVTAFGETQEFKFDHEPTAEDLLFVEAQMASQYQPVDDSLLTRRL